MALLAGVDVVIELPLPYVLGGADYFARGAVGLLAATGVVDALCFGSESGDINALRTGGKILAEEPPVYKEALRTALDKGQSFAAARGAGLMAAMGLHPGLFDKPNNGLGMEYCKALTLLDEPMAVFTSFRAAGGPSATAVRQGFVPGETRDDMPGFSCEIVNEAFEKGETVRLDDFSDMVRYAFAQGEWKMEEGLGNRFKRRVMQHRRLSDLLAAVKSKRYTLTRLQRTAMRILLNVTAADMAEYEAAGGPGYIRVLGFRKESAALVGEMTRRATLPVITTGAVMDNLIASGGTAGKMLAKELEAGDIYCLAYKNGSKGFRGERAAALVRV